MNNETEKQGLTCPITGCPIKGLLCTTIAVFLTIFGFEWAFHGIYMMPQYEATASLWRPMEESQALMHISIIRTAIAAFVISVLYCWTQRSCCNGSTAFRIKFGLMVGLLLGMWDFCAYVWMPIPYELALSWLIGGILMGLLVGIVLAIGSKMCKKGSCSKGECN